MTTRQALIVSLRTSLEAEEELTQKKEADWFEEALMNMQRCVTNIIKKKVLCNIKGKFDHEQKCKFHFAFL